MFPTRFALILIAIPALSSIGLVVADDWLPALLLLDCVIVGILVCDLIIGMPRPGAFRLELETRSTWSHGRDEELQVHLDHLGRLGRRVTITPDLPRAIRVIGQRLRNIAVPGRQRASLTFTLQAVERGEFHIGGIHLASRSRLGLWRRHLFLRDPQQVHVYPNLKQLAEYALLARTDRLNLIGVRTMRRVGGDTEFERLREYQSDDPLQRIDWKATARRDELTVRDYQINQSQTILLMVDAGRMMVSRFDDAEGNDAGSLLDQCIDAALMLAYVAITQGDRVGLIAYADGIKRYVPAKGGPRQLNRLIHALHDLQPCMVESRHDEAFLHLQRQERKRSLAICFTHLLDEVNADLIRTHLAHLAGRHLPIAVLLRDRDVHGRLLEPPVDERDFFEAGAAAMIANWRQRVLDDLERAGALTIDCRAEDLTAAVISRYLDIKARHLL